MMATALKTIKGGLSSLQSFFGAFFIMGILDSMQAADATKALPDWLVQRGNDLGIISLINISVADSEYLRELCIEGTPP